MDKVMIESSDENFHFDMDDLNKALKHVKTGKACGLDGISPEMILHFGPKTREWLRALYNNCAETKNLPKIWRKARVVALLKPGKDPKLPGSYRPISLLCTLLKVYERLILTTMNDTIEDQLISDQAGFRAGKSCCGQVLNLTQYIEDGYEKGKITGTVFVDLSAAYDTINHRKLILKVAKMVNNSNTVGIIRSILVNRRFFVEMDGKRSRWRNQKNGLPQGSVLSPVLFNIYTNDIPCFDLVRRFIYADDLCIAAQADTFEELENILSEALKSLATYYTGAGLNANPGKTKVCAFHLKNHLAKRKLNINWQGKKLKHDDSPVYLGVTLDRTLSFKEHVQKLRKKLSSRNNLLSTLASTKWGADPSTLRQTALAVCYSTAEYCAAVWERSAHAGKVDAELNKACRTITGTLKATPRQALYILAGISPPEIRRDTITRIEREKQQNDPRHPLYGHHEAQRRLKSRKSFATTNGLGQITPKAYRLAKWTGRSDLHNNALPEPRERLPAGTNLPRRDWVALNRARSKVARTGANLVRWGFAEGVQCDCGEPTQTMEHLLNCCPAGPTCSDNDLREANDVARRWLERWRDKL